MLETFFTFIQKFFAELKISDYLTTIVPLFVLWITLRHNTKKEEKRYKLALHTKYKFFLTMIKQYIISVEVEIESWRQAITNILDDKDGFNENYIPSFIPKELRDMDKNAVYNYLDMVTTKKDFIEDFVDFIQAMDVTLDTRTQAQDVSKRYFERKEKDRIKLDSHLDNLARIRLELSTVTKSDAGIGFVKDLNQIFEDYAKIDNPTPGKLENVKEHLYKSIVNLCQKPSNVPLQLMKIRNDLIFLANDAIHTIDLHENALNQFSFEMMRCVVDLKKGRDFIQKELPIFENFLNPPYYP